MKLFKKKPTPKNQSAAPQQPQMWALLTPPEWDIVMQCVTRGSWDAVNPIINKLMAQFNDPKFQDREIPSPARPVAGAQMIAQPATPAPAPQASATAPIPPAPPLPPLPKE